MQNLDNDEIMILVLVIVLILVELIYMYINHTASTWPTAQGELDISISMTKRPNLVGYFTNASYTYVVHGQDYNSNRIAYATLDSLFSIFRNMYIKEGIVTVYYDPKKPQKSVLVPGVRLFHVLDICLMLSFLYFMGQLFGV